MTNSITQKAQQDSNNPTQLHHHMTVQWQKFIHGASGPARQSSLQVRASIVGRTGILLLSCGTGSWRVRDAMNIIATSLGVTCAADIGLTTLTFTCFDGVNSYTQNLALASTGVNTDKLTALEHFVNHFAQLYADQSAESIHQTLDIIQHRSGNYSAPQVGLAAGIACAGFIFLLGGGWVEMLGCFFGATLGNYTRRKLIDRHITTVVNTSLAVAVACLTYFLVFHLLGLVMPIAQGHEAGYIGAMLFVIPGFPFITSMLDISKSDMRSGLERLTFALLVTLSATLVGWLVAMLVQLKPADFIPLGLTPLTLMGLRLLASFAGVYGFSMMFNSRQKMAITAGIIGAIANTTRLELVDLAQMPPAAAAFIGALIAGLLASIINKKTSYPRIALTVPAIVIMVPGLYIYRGIFNLGLNNINVGAIWLIRAAIIMLFLPFGLFVARFLLDKKWRHVD
ncbi:threonine/serine ThrE exporter family protein [Convivina intestini]|uniref:threonine/serine ThrE exporter family protein n=1 Tax=Convivina intestini TaxID=1505726 RepID=UPI00200CABB7|nr:threonine/serine exporter family protein [Convivina intestini]CAH1857183.1 hypothetical protein R078131_01550 [Convivina intestini]